MLKKIKPITTKLLNIIYPPRCISCGDHINENGNICHTCWDNINFITDPQCRICGFPFEAEMDSGLCAGCIQEQPHFAKARAVFLYDDASRNMITSFKYSDRIENRAAYARWMARVGAEMLKDSDYIIPVPIHFGKLLIRKYNQAGLLALEIAKISNNKVLVNSLIRKKYTRKQAGLNRRVRFKNISGAFKVNPKYNTLLKGKNILLVDDVITTGATADECAKILYKAGVNRVEVLTLAKTLY